MKVCPHCNLNKQACEFAISRARRDGLQAYCKTCLSVIKRLHRIEHPGHRREQKQAYYRANRERLAALTRKNNQERRAGRPPYKPLYAAEIQDER